MHGNRAKASISGAGLSASAEESHSSAYYGLSVGFKVSKGLSINAAADFTRFEFGGEKERVRLLSFGTTYAF